MEAIELLVSYLIWIRRLRASRVSEYLYMEVIEVAARAFRNAHSGRVVFKMVLKTLHARVGWLTLSRSLAGGEILPASDP